MEFSFFQRGYRFRYKSEGETHGGIPGEPDAYSGNKKFYPTIQVIFNFFSLFP